MADAPKKAPQSDRDPLLIESLHQFACLVGMRFVVDEEKVRQFDTQARTDNPREVTARRFANARP